MVKLHGNPLSNCTRRVVCVLYEKQIDFEWVTVDYVHDAHKSSEYVAKHPFGQIPYLEDDGFIVYESRAICQYLAAKYAGQGTDLYPAPGDWEGLALLQQGISIEQSNFDPFVSKIFYEKVFKARRNIGTGCADPVRVAEYLAGLEGKLKAYETILSRQKYLTGDKISLADLIHLPYGTTLEKIGLNEVFAKYPAFYSWLKGMQERESWKKANEAISYDKEGVAYVK